MILDAIVNKDGTLVAKVPKALWGKRVKVIIQTKQKKSRGKSGQSVLVASAPIAPGEDQETSLRQWEKISTILNEVDQLNLPQRTIDEILQDVRELRETA